jgi:hypothetical protein
VSVSVKNLKEDAKTQENPEGHQPWGSCHQGFNLLICVYCEFPASLAKADLEKNVILTLNAVPLDLMRRYVAHSSIIIPSHSRIIPI